MSSIEQRKTQKINNRELVNLIIVKDKVATNINNNSFTNGREIILNIFDNDILMYNFTRENIDHDKPFFR